MHIITRIAGLATGTILGIGLAFGAAAVELNTPTQPESSEIYTACATEDSAGPCMWDATVSGNGQGRSFIVTADQQIIYL